jgi:hypothetical protein
MLWSVNTRPGCTVHSSKRKTKQDTLLQRYKHSVDKIQRKTRNNFIYVVTMFLKQSGIDLITSLALSTENPEMKEQNCSLEQI